MALIGCAAFQSQRKCVAHRLIGREHAVRVYATHYRPAQPIRDQGVVIARDIIDHFKDGS